MRRVCYMLYPKLTVFVTVHPTSSLFHMCSWYPVLNHGLWPFIHHHHCFTSVLDTIAEPRFVTVHRTSPLFLVCSWYQCWTTVCDHSSNITIVSHVFLIPSAEPLFVTVHPSFFHVHSWYPVLNCCSRPFSLRYSRYWNSQIFNNITSCVQDFGEK